jgi:transposase
MKPDAGSRTKTVVVARCRYGAEFKRQVVRMSLAPGASAAKIALEHQLNANLLFKWRRLYLRQISGAPAESVKLLPVTVGEVAQGPVAETARRRPRGRSRSGTIEIELPGGRIWLSGANDIEWVRAVLDMVRGR